MAMYEELENKVEIDNVFNFCVSKSLLLQEKIFILVGKNLM